MGSKLRYDLLGFAGSAQPTELNGIGCLGGYH